MKTLEEIREEIDREICLHDALCKAEIVTETLIGHLARMQFTEDRLKLYRGWLEEIRKAKEIALK